MALVIQKWTSPTASYTVKIKDGSNAARYRIAQPVNLKPAADDLSLTIEFGKYFFKAVSPFDTSMTINVDAAAQSLTGLTATQVCDILGKLIFII